MGHAFIIIATCIISSGSIVKRPVIFDEGKTIRPIRRPEGILVINSRIAVSSNHSKESTGTVRIAAIRLECHVFQTQCEHVVIPRQCTIGNGTLLDGRLVVKSVLVVRPQSDFIVHLPGHSSENTLLVIANPISPMSIFLVHTGNRQSQFVFH